MYSIHCGDNLSVLKSYPDNHFTAVVTDPPAGISFMGNTWDHHKGGRDEWINWLSSVLAECYRVTKPGGYLLCWSIPRTSHWTGQAIELAGWEIRDVVSHIFGAGFPKGQNIGKAIDKKQGNERKVIGQYQHPDGKPRHVENHANNKTVRVSDHNWGMTQSGFQPITAPVSDEAKIWDGYGTALKPATEFWWLAQKPIDKTYVNNVLTHGCGGLNIDESRIGTDIITAHGGINKDRIFGMGSGFPALNPGSNIHSGRFPANIILSHSPDCVKIGERKIKSHGSVSGNEPSDPIANTYGEYDRKPFTAHGNGDGTETVEVWVCADGCPIKLMGEQSGNKKSGWKNTDVPQNMNSTVFIEGENCGYDMKRTGEHYSDTGTAARYFKNLEYDPFIYCSKASKKDRGEGNQHPTVKSTKLMEYLLTLVKQPEVNLILDPFAGSGSTLVAAERLGIDSVGIEQSQEYVDIIHSRLQ